MAKRIMKSSNKPWPSPKRGKARALTKRPSTSMKYVKVPYVRHGTPTTRNRSERERWGLSIHKFMTMRQPALLTLLRQHKLLPDWSKRLCPHCGQGKVTTLSYDKTRQTWVYRCRASTCHKFILPHDFHPIFIKNNWSSGTSLAMQASILLCAVAGVPQHCLAKILDVDDKVVSRIYGNNEAARARFVLQNEKHIQYGGINGWVDVEADEVDLGKGLIENLENPKLNTKWEQWCGIVQRGCPSSLRLIPLKPPLTKTRSPGPGPIRKRDWKPLGKKFLEGRKIILHTDGARAYKLKLDAVVHCNVIHKKKKVTKGKKATQYETSFF